MPPPSQVQQSSDPHTNPCLLVWRTLLRAAHRVRSCLRLFGRHILRGVAGPVQRRDTGPRLPLLPPVHHLLVLACRARATKTVAGHGE